MWVHSGATVVGNSQYWSQVPMYQVSLELLYQGGIINLYLILGYLDPEGEVPRLSGKWFPKHALDKRSKQQNKVMLPTKRTHQS